MPTPTRDGAWAINAVDEVRNAPDLTNRPLHLSSRAMTAEMAATLRRRSTVSVVGWPAMHALGFGPNVIGSGSRFDAVTKSLATAWLLGAVTNRAA